MSLGIKQEFNFNAQALALRGKRQEVLAANLANAETPFYKARDFQFADALKEATQGGNPFGMNSTLSLRRTNDRHIPGESTANLPSNLLYRIPTQASIDGNSVDIDLERAQFTDNSLKYDAAIRMLNGQIRTLQQAMQNN